MDKCQLILCFSAKVEQEYIVLLAKYDCDIGASHALAEGLSEDNEVIKAEIKKMEVCNTFDLKFNMYMCRTVISFFH